MENNNNPNQPPPVPGGSGVNLQEERDAAISSAGVQAVLPEYQEKATQRELYRQTDLRAAAAVAGMPAVGLPVAAEQDALGAQADLPDTLLSANTGMSRMAAEQIGNAIEHLEQTASTRANEKKRAVDNAQPSASQGGNTLTNLELAALARSNEKTRAVDNVQPSASEGGNTIASLEQTALARANQKKDILHHLEDSDTSRVIQTSASAGIPGAFAFSNPARAAEAAETAEESVSQEAGINILPVAVDTPSVPVDIPVDTRARSSGLVEAKPVRDDEEEGIVVGTRLDQEERKEKDAKFRAWTIRFFLLFCLILVVVVVTAVAVTNNDDDDDGPVSTSAPTQATVFPTPAPTPYAVSLPPFSLEALENPGSPQTMAYEWLRKDSLLQEYSEEKRLQRFALATFFYATMGLNWTINSSWLSYDVDECDWYSNFDVGVQLDGQPYASVISQSVPNMTQCDEEGNYLQLVLAANGLVGTLPKEISLLSSARRIDLANNVIMGSLPTELGLLSNLEVLGFLGMALTSTLPSELGDMTAMRELEIAKNPEITGTIPSEFQYMTSLSYLCKLACVGFLSPCWQPTNLTFFCFCLYFCSA